MGEKRKKEINKKKKHSSKLICENDYITNEVNNTMVDGLVSSCYMFHLLNWRIPLGMAASKK